MNDRVKLLYENLEACTNDGERMNILFNIANSLLNLNKTRVLEIADEIKELAERNDSNMGRSYYHSARGRVFFKKAMYGECEEELEKALQIALLTDRLVEQASCHDSLGMVYGFQYRYQEALDASLRALATYEQVPGKLSHKFKMVSYNNIGSVYKKMARFDESEASFRKGLAIAEEFEDDKMKSNMMCNIAIIKVVQQQYDEGLLLAQSAIAGFRKDNHKNGEADATAIIAQCLLGKGEFAHALTHYLAAIKIHKAIDHKNGEAVSLWGMGNVYMKMDAFEEAIKHYEKALAIANEVGNWGEICNVHLLLSTAYKALKQPEKALAILDAGTIVATEKNLADYLAQMNEQKLLLGNELKLQS